MTTTKPTYQEYTLRVAFLQDLIETRTRIHRQSVKNVVNSPLPTTGLTSSSRRSHEASSILALDLSSLLGRDASKSPKYPERMLKILDGILQRIAMGQESKYSDQRFRRTCALFWSSVWADKNFQKQMKDSRKVEDLILAFVTSSTKALKKEEDLQGGAWKGELDSQVSLFLQVIGDALSAGGPISNELASRLASYQDRMRAPTPSLENDYTLAQSTTDNTDQDGVDIGSGDPLEQSVGPLLVVAGGLFGHSSADLWDISQELKGICTEQAALDDLKSCLKSLNTGISYPYGPEDFPDPASWALWKSSEVSTLSQMMLLMMQSNPALTQSSDRSSIHDSPLQLDGLSLNQAAHTFTFVPADARTAYCRLLDRCLDSDLELLQTLPEDEDVSLGILSAGHVSLLGDCAMRWRLSPAFRSWSFAHSILNRFEQGLVPSACVHEAMAMLDKVRAESSIQSWPLSEQKGLNGTLSRCDHSLLAALEQSLSANGSYHSNEFYEAVKEWRALGVPEARQFALNDLADDIANRIRTQASEAYVQEASSNVINQGSRTQATAMRMAGWIEKEAKRLDKRFAEPILPAVDVVAIVLHQHLSLWFQDLADTTIASTSTGDTIDMSESFALLRRAMKLQEMGSAFPTGPISPQYPIATLFKGQIQAWLDQTSAMTKQWADQAIIVDSVSILFAPATTNGPSSSVTDLFDSFRSATDFLLELNWPDREQLASFATRLAKIISLSISDYCNKIEQLFAEDMRRGESFQATAQQRAWVEKARATLASLQGERRLQAFFSFTAESCVKLNNIESARQQLDRLYERMGVDQLAGYHRAQQAAETTHQTFLFTVKIVLAEGLVLDSSGKPPDAFVILSDEHGTRYAKTRTIYDDFDPRWDESFDIPVRGAAWFMATVRHRTLVGKHDLLGRAYLRLDPSQFMDLVSKDILLPLDTRGHILFRISMEGERDDIQFHFGRAFRWLKRAESDMVRTFVDKMSPVLRHTLSRASIKSVMKPVNAIPLDYNEALGKLSAAYRSAIGTPEYKIPAAKDDSRRGPTDAEIETAIHPLFDYLDTNIHTLASTLSSDAMQMVMTKLWKQILATIEALIVPPISDKPSHMRALGDGELDIALKWLRFLRDFFYAGGDPSGIPLTTLQNPKFNEILSIRIYYDWNTDDLMEECIRGFQSTLKYKATRPGKSLLSQRNLGTIRARKSAKRAMPSTGANTEMIMRILRMRSGTQEFLAQQIQTLSVVKLSNHRTTRVASDENVRR